MLRVPDCCVPGMFLQVAYISYTLSHTRFGKSRLAAQYSQFTLTNTYRTEFPAPLTTTAPRARFIPCKRRRVQHARPKRRCHHDARAHVASSSPPHNKDDTDDNDAPSPPPSPSSSPTRPPPLRGRDDDDDATLRQRCVVLTHLARPSTRDDDDTSPSSRPRGLTHHSLHILAGRRRLTSSLHMRRQRRPRPSLHMR